MTLTIFICMFGSVWCSCDTCADKSPNALLFKSDLITYLRFQVTLEYDVNKHFLNTYCPGFVFFEVQTSYPPDHGSPSSHFKHIELRRDGKPSNILLLHSSVMNEEEMEPSHFSMFRTASFFSTRKSDIMSNHGPHNCISL